MKFTHTVSIVTAAEADGYWSFLSCRMMDGLLQEDERSSVIDGSSLAASGQNVFM